MSTTCDRFSHPLQYQAMVYSSQEELLNILATRTRGRVDERDPVLVAVDPDSEKKLRESLGDDADVIEFVDPDELSGHTAGRVIRRFMTTARHAAAAGPVSVLVQHPRNEAADDDGTSTDGDDSEAWLRLECEVNATVESIPIDLVRLYDVDSSACAIVDNAQINRSVGNTSAERTETVAGSPEPAPERGPAYDVHWFDHLDASALRGWLYFHSALCGLAEGTADEFVVAVHEAVATASRSVQVTGTARTTGPTVGTPLDETHSRESRVPVRIWPWLRRVTCEIPIALPGHGERAAHAHPLLSALWAVDEACRSVHVDVYRDTPSSRYRIRVCADRTDTERISGVSPTKGNQHG